MYTKFQKSKIFVNLGGHVVIFVSLSDVKTYERPNKKS